MPPCERGDSKFALLIIIAKILLTCSLFLNMPYNFYTHIFVGEPNAQRKTLMVQISISYSRRDLAFVEKLAVDLKADGLDVWYDPSRLEGSVY